MAYNYTLELNSTIKDVDIVNSLFSIASRYKQSDKTISNVFVAGCGNGKEASAIRNSLKVSVIAVDNGLQSEYEDETLKVLNRDLMKLDYPDNTFDLVYSYHVLEHVPDPTEVVKKLSCMLTDAGLLVVGFPNRNRLFGYVGSQNANLYNKFLWNFKDYSYRLKGRFQNKYGAHAGFTKKEFTELSKPYFTQIHCVSDLYFLDKYRKKKWLINLLMKTRLSNIFYPAIYFICIK